MKRFPLWHKLDLTGQTNGLGPEPSNKEARYNLSYWIQSGAQLNIWCDYMYTHFCQSATDTQNPRKKTKHVWHCHMFKPQSEKTTSPSIVRRPLTFTRLARHSRWCAAGCLGKSSESWVPWLSLSCDQRRPKRLRGDGVWEWEVFILLSRILGFLQYNAVVMATYQQNDPQSNVGY